MFVRAYLRASSSEQDAMRARGALDSFAAERGLRIAARYVENESGAKLHRPELFRLLGSGLVDYSQKMTVAARAMAEKKAVGQRS